MCRLPVHGVSAARARCVRSPYTVPDRWADRIVVASLLSRAGIEPPAGLRSARCTACATGGADEFEEKYTATDAQRHRLDPGLAQAGMQLFRSLPGMAERSVLLCPDLHPDNALAARREPWLVIDPKPYLGDPVYDPLQHMLNFPDRLIADPTGYAQRMAGLLGLDAERLRQWLFARCVQEFVDQPHLQSVAIELAA